MSTERDEKEFERYLEFQRAQRGRRVETLGGAATVLFLSTIDLGLSGGGDSSAETHAPRPHEPEVAPVVELSQLRANRQRHLAGFAADASAVELGYAHAA